MKTNKSRITSPGTPVSHSNDLIEQVKSSIGQLSDLEMRALQGVADRCGTHWRTKLYSAHQAGQLTGILKDIMNRSDAGTLIARVRIIPRSLGTTALSYGPIR